MIYELTKPGRRLSLEAWGQTLLDLAADRGIGVRHGIFLPINGDFRVIKNGDFIWRFWEFTGIICIYIYTIWLFNIAMENHPF